MIVISLTDCPPKVRGDLSKWLMEINTGVFVGNASARVRDQLWDRVCQGLKTGRATMVFSASGEQKMEFRVHNTSWVPADYDGLTLIRRPLPAVSGSRPLPENFSHAAQRLLAKKHAAAKARRVEGEDYVAIDLETTGLSQAKDEIIELAAVRVHDGTIAEEFSCLLKSEKPIPMEIISLTGITEEMKERAGCLPKDGLSAFAEFVGQARLVSHNAAFDMGFLRAAFKRCGLMPLTNRCTDTLSLARRKLDDVENYKLMTVALFFGLEVTEGHRALPDCRLTSQVYEKLKQL